MEVCTVCGEKADIEMMDGSWFCATHDPLKEEAKHARDALIERLAAAACDTSPCYGTCPPFEHFTDEEKVIFRRQVQPLVPAVVEFVAEWLDDYWFEGLKVASIANDWRQEMKEVTS